MRPGKPSNAALVPFEQTPYATQVRRLRRLAVRALTFFNIDVRKIEFINHGENATFKVIAKNGDAFLLRIHRRDYHSYAALLEELEWLKLLSENGLNVPRPVQRMSGAPGLALFRSNSYLADVDSAEVGPRQCDLFHWIDGRFLSKSISESDMFKIGALLAKLQAVGRKAKAGHRRYWTSEGLAGENTKFGPLDRITVLKPAEQKKLTAMRKSVLKKLKSYEKRFPRKMGLIHADLHFGNLLKTKTGEIAAIDFDDCGYGFYVYDLVIPLVGLEHHLRRNKRFRSYPALKEALLSGYASRADLTDHDRAVLQDLIIARKLLMVGWLNSRSDNPRLKPWLKKSARGALKYIAKPYL